MKSVALTEGKKAYFYDLNRQLGIKRNSSPTIRQRAELQPAAWNIVTAPWQGAAQALPSESCGGPRGNGCGA